MNLAGGNLALISEFLPLGSLFDILHGQSSLSQPPNHHHNRYFINNNPQRLNIALDVADGMRYLHQMNMLHRNLKSSNILMDGHRKARIGDFGLSSSASSLQSRLLPIYSSDDDDCGIAWIAPELFICEENISSSSDVYSFGVVLWELFSGQIPWHGMSCAGITSVVTSGKRLAIAPHWPCPIKSLLIQCFQPPKYRPKFDDIYRILVALTDRCATIAASGATTSSASSTTSSGSVNSFGDASET